ncbi:MAG: hypothetical protein AB1568_04180 [Thermodesulfobacteriota bacterium]
MAVNSWFRPLFFLALLAAIVAAGCSSHEVRHLSSDACLVVPGRTSRQEVLGILGFPDQKTVEAEAGEAWLYYQSNKSFLRRTPYVGARLGDEDFDLLTVTFDGDMVKSCTYRNLSDEEFRQLGLPQEDAAEKDE